MWLHSQGFTLQDADVSEVLRVVTELKDAEIYVDPNFPANQACLRMLLQWLMHLQPCIHAPPLQVVDQLIRTVRLLQVSTEVLSQENDQLTAEFSTIQEDNTARAKAWAATPQGQG